MSLRTSQENFQKAFKEEKKTITEKFLSELRKYLKARKNNKQYKELWECMYKNEPLASFLCRNDVCEMLEKEMLHRRLPFVVVSNRNGELGYIIRYADRGVTNDAIKVVLKKKGTYCEIITGEELSSIDKNQKEDQQGLVAINGLNYKEARLLELICKKKNFLEYIAIDKMSDGTFRVMVPGEQAVSGKLLALSLFELIMKTEGPNKAFFDNEIENVIRIDQLRSCDFGRDSDSFKALFFVGKDNQFMKLEKNKFEYGIAVIQNGQKKLIPWGEMSKGMRGYSECEASYLNRIQDVKVFDDLRQVYGYIDSSSIENEKIVGDKAFISAVYSVVSENSAEVDIMNIPGRWVEKTEYITYEIGRVISGLISNNVPEGYTELDMQEIKSSISSYDIDVRNYSMVSEVMKGLIITDEISSLIALDDVKESEN